CERIIPCVAVPGQRQIEPYPPANTPHPRPGEPKSAARDPRFMSPISGASGEKTMTRGFLSLTMSAHRPPSKADRAGSLGRPVNIRSKVVGERLAALLEVLLYWLAIP